MNKKEKTVLSCSLLLVMSVFGYAVYSTLNPELEVLEGKIFDVWENPNGNFYILTYGKGKLIIQKDLDLEIDSTYQFNFKCGGQNCNLVTELISVFKIEPEYEVIYIWSADDD